MTEVAATHSGGCLCGGVRYETRGPLRDAIACHCSQCRRTSGHYHAMTSVPNADLTLTSSASSPGTNPPMTPSADFAAVCGGNLFWRPTGEDRTAITAGTLDTPTHIRLMEHIFVADKSDYYEIDDDLPKKTQGL